MRKEYVLHKHTYTMKGNHKIDGKCEKLTEKFH